MPGNKKSPSPPALDHVDDFRDALVRWFGGNARDYPWRRTRDPYAVFVSEIMLQQTQVATVLDRGYYARWMRRFPDTATLAAAEESEVLKAWEGLGYYSRARNLHRAARHIEDALGGIFPATAEEIRALPGVGRYTAGAVATFARDLPEPIVEANIARVLTRLFDFHGRIDDGPGQKQLWAWATALVPEEGARTYNSALMELGQVSCSPRKPGCDACPVLAFCLTRDPEALPVKKPRPTTVHVDEHVRLVRANGAILLQQEQERRREGLWKLPAFLDGASWEKRPLVLKSQYSITHYRVTLFVHEDTASSGDPLPPHHAWVPETALHDVPMPSPYRKALVAIGEFDSIFPMIPTP
jgi:A/G-specific adenine glycosylase